MSGPPADLSLLRFLRARVDQSVVLNPGADVPAGGDEAAKRLMQAARTLLARGECEGVPYAAIAASPEFAAYRALTRELRGFDPATLTGSAQRTAFWINVYNALVIDAVISLGVRGSIRDAPGFFRRAAYRVGPYRFALDEIEHGLLRGNRSPFARLPPPFPPGDVRAGLGPDIPDPRVHFALNCGTRSCPPVAFYDADRLEAQLDAATSSFINAEGVRLEDGESVLSPIFEFYAEDFGGRTGAREWALRYLIDPLSRERLARGPVRLASYDWSLNGVTA